MDMVKDAEPEPRGGEMLKNSVMVTTIDTEGFHLDVPTDNGADINSQATIDLIRTLSRRFPDHVADKIMRFGEDSGNGVLLVRNLDVGDIPATPTKIGHATKPDLTSELTLLAAIRLLGHPIGYLPEHGGDLVQNIFPTKDSATRQVSTSSAAELMFHTEAAFHPHMPRWIGLLCIRGDNNAHTTFASIRDIVRTLENETLEQLRKPEYRCGVDESYGTGRTIGTARPVLWGPNGGEYLWFDADLCIADTTEGSRALDALREATRACQGAVTLRKGDLLIIDNYVAVHGRSPFLARFDGTDRWLQRGFVTADLAPSAAERDGRIVTTTFSA